MINVKPDMRALYVPCKKTLVLGLKIEAARRKLSLMEFVRTSLDSHISAEVRDFVTREGFVEEAK